MKSRTSPRRILNILEEILVDPDNYTAKKISHKLKIPLATVYRQLEILCEEGFLIQNINKTFTSIKNSDPTNDVLMTNKLL